MIELQQGDILKAKDEAQRRAGRDRQAICQNGKGIGKE